MATQHFAQGGIKQVGARVVGSTGSALLGIYASHHGGFGMLRQLLGEVDRQVVLFLGVENLDGLEFADQYTGVAYLTSTLGIERGLVEHNLVERLVLLLHLAVTQDGGLVFGIVIAYKLGGTLAERNPVARLHRSGVARTLLLLLHLGIKGLDVGRHAVLAQDEFGEVEREAVGIVEGEGIFAADFRLASSLGFGHGLVQQFDAGL